MSGTGVGAFVGFQPKVTVSERMLMSSVPEEQREAFTAFLGEKVERTRSGEIVFAVADYERWKQQ